MGNRRLTIFTALLSMLIGAAGVQAQVWNPRPNDNQVRNVLQRLETHTDVFRRSIDRRFDNNDRWDNTRADERMTPILEAFENATDELKRSFDDNRRVSQADVMKVLDNGLYIDQFMKRVRMANNVESQWTIVKSDLNQLASIYRINYNWNQTLPPFGGTTGEYLYQPNDAQVRTLLARLETRTNAFTNVVKSRFNNNNRWDNTNRDERIEPYIEAFENATDVLRRSFNDRRVTRTEVMNVMNYGWYVNDFMTKNRLANNVERSWTLVKNDLNQLSNIYRLNYSWNQTLPPFRGLPNNGDVLYQPNEAQVRALLTRLETRTNTFTAAVKTRFDNNNRWDNTRRDEQIEPYINAFENATDVLRRSFNDRRVTRTEVMDVMNYGWYVNDFMTKNRLANNVERSWTLVKSDLDALSTMYRLNYSWTQTPPPFPTDRWGNQANRLDGTYRLNTSLSDNVSTIIDREIRDTSVRARQRQMLEQRLGSPQALAIDVNGSQVTMATNYAAPVTLTADGRTITETNNRGRTTRTTVSMTGNSLSIVTDGDRNQDYRVTFTPIGGNRIRVTRSVYLENQNELITANSVYDRTSETATWPPIDRGRPGWNDGRNTNYGAFYIPNGTTLTAVLRNRIATNVSQAGDPFTMEVTSPSQYAGAIIRGRIAEADSSGRVSGRANLTMDFDSIQYRGNTYSFAGIIDSAREADGDIIRINNEGTVRDGNQTTRTVTRAGIGAALGALIGAITGGGDGAAIGAAIGAGAGAGSVLIQGRDNLELEQGTQFTITATGPTTVGYRN